MSITNDCFLSRGSDKVLFMSFSPHPLTCLQVLPELEDGGVERGTVEMAIFLKRQKIDGFAVRPIVASAGGKRVGMLSAENIPHVTLPLMAKNPVSILLNAWRLYRLIVKEDVRLVHARSRAPAWSAFLACRWAGVPFITTFHGTHGLKGVGKKFYNSVMVRGDAVIANSSFVKDHINEHYRSYLKQAEVPVAPRGANVDIFRPNAITPKEKKALRLELGVDEGQLMVLLVGRLSRWKGQDIAIKALAEPCLMGKDIVLVLAGGVDTSNTYLEELQTLAEDLGVADQVRFLGARCDVSALYNAADIALSASTKPEAFGRVAVEAMASGTSVVATAHGGSLETVKHGETGILVKPSDPDMLAQAIVDLYDQPTVRQALGVCGVRHVREHFSLLSMCQAEFTTYERLLGGALHGET